MSAYYTVDQIAQLIDMHPKTIRRYIQEQRLAASKVGKQYRVSKSELDRFMGQSQAEAMQPNNISTHYQVEVSTNIDIAGVTNSSATFLTQRILSVLNKLVDVRADCIYYEPQSKLKVLLFGSIETTDQMLKHINILISQAASSSK